MQLYAFFYFYGLLSFCFCYDNNLWNVGDLRRGTFVTNIMQERTPGVFQLEKVAYDQYSVSVIEANNHTIICYLSVYLLAVLKHYLVHD